MTDEMPVHKYKLKERKALTHIPRERWGWWIDVCPGQTLTLREATESDLKRCIRHQDDTRTPNDFLCEPSDHGALVSKEAVEMVSFDALQSRDAEIAALKAENERLSNEVETAHEWAAAWDDEAQALKAKEEKWRLKFEESVQAEADCRLRIAALKAKVEDITTNAVELLGSDACDEHHQEILGESFAEFQKSEQEIGCKRCLKARVEQLAKKIIEIGDIKIWEREGEFYISQDEFYAPKEEFYHGVMCWGGGTLLEAIDALLQEPKGDGE